MTSTHSIYKEFDNQMKTMISTYANNNPAPQWGVISEVSLNEKFVDVNIGNGTLKAVTRFGGKPNVGDNCIVIFMNGSYEKPVAICNGYESTDPPYNLLNNGRFQKTTDNGFEDWTGGIVSTKNYWYDKSTAQILPNHTMTSNYVDITSLYNSELEEVSEIMLFYFYLGSIEIEFIDKKTGKPLIIAPESLQLKKEILEPVNSWHYARTHFLLRDHEQIAVRFTNPSTTTSAYIDGVRLWSPDFKQWYPSTKDKGV